MGLQQPAVRNISNTTDDTERIEEIAERTHVREEQESRTRLRERWPA
jgi:hypothetical protein